MGFRLLVLLLSFSTSFQVPAADPGSRTPSYNESVHSACNLMQVGSVRHLNPVHERSYHDGVLYDFPGSGSDASEMPERRRASTFAVYTRIIEQELPYFDSFVQHYVSLGVRSFYLLSNQAGNDVLLKENVERLSKAGPRMVLYVREGAADAHLHEKKLFDRIIEDFVIGVDIDEFWMVPEKYKSLSDFVKHQPAHLYWGSWLIVPNDSLTNALKPPYRGYTGVSPHLRGTRKWMARTTALKTIHIHQPDLMPGLSTQGHHGSFIVHFCSRSFWDMVAKTAAQKFTSSRQSFYHGCEGSDEMRRLFVTGKLPWRLQMLAFHMNVPKTSTTSSLTLLRYDDTLEKRISSRLLSMSEEKTLEIVQKFHQVYKSFKMCLAAVMRMHPHPWGGMLEKEVTSFLETCECGNQTSQSMTQIAASAAVARSCNDDALGNTL